MTPTSIAEHLLDHAVGSLRALDWPPPNPGQPPTRTWIDMVLTLRTWIAGGCPMETVAADHRSPALAADLPLATAPLHREACCYVIGAQMVYLTRHPAGAVVDVAPDRQLKLSPRGAILTYLTTRGPGHPVGAGYISLADQPTPRHLRLLPGKTLSEIYLAPLSEADLAEDGLALARVIPLHYA